MNKYIFKFKRQFISTIILKVISSVLWVYTAIVIQNIVDTAVGGNMDKFAGAVILSIVYFLSFVLLLFISDLVKSYYIKNTIQNLKKRFLTEPYTRVLKILNQRHRQIIFPISQTTLTFWRTIISIP